MDLLQSLRIFMKVSDLSSFTRAAETLQVGRPQVTLAVRDLEAMLGVRLFQRTTRKVTLTTEGGAFYARAEGILTSVADASAMFGSTASALRGKLRIDIPSAFAQTGFVDSLREFSRIYPDVAMVLGVTDRTVDMVAEGVDCVIRIGELKDSSLIAKRIGAAVMVTCASPAYLSEFGKPETLADLASHRSVNFLSGSSRRALPWTFTDNGKTETMTPKGSILVNDSHAYVNCGVSGFGIIQVPGIMVDAYLQDGRLTEVLADFRPSPRTVSMLYPSKSYLAPQVRVFVDWVHERFPVLHGCWLRD